ncbi:MAG: magnesium transporter [Epulopiscium sp.]|nr:magnesium transporter [Candidatus Epulonipiscium sp.]
MDFTLLESLLESKDFFKLKRELSEMQLADIAEFLDQLDGKTVLLVFRLLPKEKAADVFSYLSNDQQKQICVLVNDQELAQLVDELDFDDKIDLIEEMPANAVKKILKNATETERKLINQFLNYPERSAGSLMTIEFVDIKKEMTVKEALHRIRSLGFNKDTIYTCYVITATRVLEGIVELKDLVLAPGDQKIQDLMETGVVFVGTHDDQEDVADVFKKYDLLSVPVVDNEQRLVGIITIDDIVDVMEQEATEDFHRMAAIEPSDEVYLDTSIFILARRRIIWLLVLMVSATFTGMILSKYEAALESVVALTFFIPMLMDTGGNAGSQASTLVIRSLTLGEIEYKDFWKVLCKEVGVSMIVGFILAALNFIRIRFVQGYSLGISLTVTVTLFFTVLLAKVVGGLLPIVAKKLKFDPAIMASPLITTIVDTFSLLIYFGVASWILGI